MGNIEDQSIVFIPCGWLCLCNVIVIKGSMQVLFGVQCFLWLRIGLYDVCPPMVAVRSCTYIVSAQSLFTVGIVTKKLQSTAIVTTDNVK